jgi:acyl-CoA reductase-like NAD-dependent aldehyde dehydrogenase
MELCASIFEYYAGAADKVMGEMYDAGPEKLGYVRREPVGVVAAITPWNYPLTEQVQKVAPALAMGNCVVVKPPEDAPLTGLSLGQLVLEAGLPPGVLNVIPGPGHIVGEALIHHPDVALIVFTGSTEVGKRIMHAAADRIGKVELELGGKSPQVVFPDANLDDAIAGIALGLFKMAGQECCAGTRMLVHRDIFGEVVDRLKAAAEAQKLGNPLDNTVTMGPLISQKQRERVHGYTSGAQSEGAVLVTGGCPVTEGQPAGSSFYAPTLFTNVDPAHRIFQEEVFGPVGVIVPFEREDEAITLANATKYGLAAAVWTNDLSTAHRVARRIESGMVWINEYYGHLMQLPFGGYKQSGIGRDLSLHALETYSQLKEITVRLGPKRF